MRIPGRIAPLPAVAPLAARPLPADFGATLGHEGFRPYRDGGKRLLDLTLASMMLVVAAPILGVLAALVARDGGKPVFAQVRIGCGGRPYRCYKLRSMVVDAEARLQTLLASDPVAASEWADGQKLSHDPRITRLGQFLRKSSLDELPQLWNVIRGEMSLIGPRPVVPDELRRYGPYADAYLRQRPGISGAWQVAGRNDISYDERVLLDADYSRRLSLPLDISILLRTVGAVLRRTGR